MGRIRAANEAEEKILRDNKMEPRCYGVISADEDSIRLLCYKTRDVIEIHRGDRKW